MKKKKRLARALKDLDQAFENLEVKPLAKADMGRVAGGTLETRYPGGFTCNFKCGNTSFWECGPSAGGTCDNLTGQLGCACS
ncbi:MAG: hypothetical protein GY856_07135 [bacterium]|nr:hypothetical protein [bacterium]